MNSRVFVVNNIAMGGVESFSLGLVHTLNKKGFKAFSVDLGNVSPGHERFLDRATLEDEIGSIEILPVNTFYEQFEELTSQDLLIIPMYANRFLKKLFELVKKHQKAPIIFGYLHNLGAYYYDNFKLYHPFISKLISVSNLGHTELLRLFPSRQDDILFLPCPSLISIDDINSKPKSSDGKLNISFVGRMEDAAKGIFRIPEIIRALEKEKINSNLRIIGTGSDLNELQARIDGLQMEYTHVDFIKNARTPKKVKEYYVLTDILLILSNYEGGPLVLYEGMSCGAVPLSFDVGMVSQVIEHKTSGMTYNVGDVKQVINDIIILNNNRQLLETMSRSALNRMNKLGYNFEIYVDKLMEVLKTAHASNPALAVNDIKLNFQKKEKNLTKWIEDIVPAEIMHRHYIGHYLNFQTKSIRTQIKSLARKKNNENLLSRIMRFAKDLKK